MSRFTHRLASQTAVPIRILRSSTRSLLGAGALILIALQGCADTGSQGAGAGAPSAGAGAGAGSGTGGSGNGAGASAGSAPLAGTSGAAVVGGTATGGGSAASGGSSGGDSAGEGGAPEPEPVFDASALDLTGSSGPELCRLSDDGRALLVGVKNAGATETGPTVIELSSDGSGYASRTRTPTLAPGESAELMLDRGPVAGFVPDWHFTLKVDPDGLHGGPHMPLSGQCDDMRSRAAAGMAPLAQWYDAGTGLWNTNDWWTSANQLETVIDYSRETGDDEYFDEIDNTFEKNKASNFDRYGYYDDDGWWAIAWIKAFDLTHQQKYLDMAKTIFARMKGGWTDQCGGGIYWAGPKAGADGNKNKNAIPNELFLQVAAKLHQRTPGDAGAGSYLDWAQREWAWFKGTGMISDKYQIVDGLNNLTDCKPAGPIFTYNQGVVVGGLTDLAASTGDATLLDEASNIAHATMMLMASQSGVLKEAPCGGDICTQFKGVFMRNLTHLYHARALPEFLVYMRHQSDNLWQSNKNAQDQFGYEWHLAFDKATASRQSSALDALVAAVSSSNLNLALGATATGSAACSAGEGAGNAIDGSSHWNSKWCSGGMSGQTLSLDLGAAREVVGFRVRHAGAGGESADLDTRDFELATSQDGQAWTTAVTVTGNTADVTTHPIPAVTARYVRLHVTTAQSGSANPAARIYELEVFGVGLD